MVMLATTLAAELENNMAIVDNELDAIDNLSSSWEAYFYDASVGGIPANPGSLSAATNAMKGALVGMSYNGSNAIQLGLIAFWSVIATAAPTIWTTVPPCTAATPPTSLATIGATLDGVFSANVAGKLDKAACMAAIANALHTLNLGGICAIPLPGAPTPIL
jgi:hypothetical protein